MNRSAMFSGRSRHVPALPFASILISLVACGSELVSSFVSQGPVFLRAGVLSLFGALSFGP